jgi:hypothetical protein
MILIAVTWAVIFVLVILLGAGTYALYLRILGSNYKTRTNLFQFAWLGYASLIALLQIYSLFFAVDALAVLLVFSISAISCCFSYRFLLQCYKQFCDIPWKLKTFLVTGLTIIVAYLSYNSTLLPILHDTNLYHLNAVKWESNFPAIPGIVNLHGRLAFNSSFHLFAALTNTWLWEDRAVYIANGFLLLLVTVQWFAQIVTIPLRGARLADAFVIFTFPLLITTAFHGNFPSLSTDIPLHILSLAIIYELLSVRTKAIYGTIHWYDSLNRKNLFSWFLILSLAAVAFSTKLGGVPLLVILVPVSLILLISFNIRTCNRYVSIRNLAVMYGLPATLILGLVARYVILSGWLIYPAPVGNLHLDWSASQEQVTNMLNWTKSWARIPGRRPEEVLGNGISYWFVPWFAEFRKNFLALILLCSGGIGLLYMALVRSARRPTIAKSFPLFLSIAIGIIGLIYWFVTAPDYRFGEVFFWIFAATAFAPLFLRLVNYHVRDYMIVALAMIIIVWSFNNFFGGGFCWLFTAAALAPLFLQLLNYRIQGYLIIALNMAILVWGLKNSQAELPEPFPDPPQLISIPPAMVPKEVLIPVRINNGQSPPLVVYKPARGDACGNSPLPCSPYVDENSTIELRVPGELQGGFRTTGPRPADMHK